MQRGNSIVNTQNERTKEIFQVLDNVLNYYIQNGFYEEYKEELEYTYTRLLLCSSLLRIVKIKDKKIRNEQLYNTWKNLNIKFPKWKNNKILNNNKTWKNRYMKTINKYTFRLYACILKFKKN